MGEGGDGVQHLPGNLLIDLDEGNRIT
jgi:hypothetical protein